ncbi:MAG: DUF4115 domain-containing protein [Desulfosarcina sp.]|nr:DUF4115 domain-containing protein [Desulfobacterales bacterium]
MTRDHKLTSFGLYLQTARLEKNISIEALSAEIRVRIEILKRLEAEDHEHLPNEVFVKGFIRTYALAVGADVEEALERYQINRARRTVPPDQKTTRSPQRNRFWLFFLGAVGAVFLVAGLTLYLYSRLNAPHDTPVAIPTAPVEKPSAAPLKPPPVEEATPPTVTSAPNDAKPLKEQTSINKKKYLLDIKAIEDTWLKIIIDDQDARQLFLKSGEVKQVQAAALFNLLIGNAGGVELMLNGSPVEVSGKSGQVVNIQLP